MGGGAGPTQAETRLVGVGWGGAHRARPRTRSLLTRPLSGAEPGLWRFRPSGELRPSEAKTPRAPRPCSCRYTRSSGCTGKPHVQMLSRGEVLAHQMRTAWYSEGSVGSGVSRRPCRGPLPPPCRGQASLSTPRCVFSCPRSPRTAGVQLSGRGLPCLRGALGSAQHRGRVTSGWRDDQARATSSPAAF